MRKFLGTISGLFNKSPEIPKLPDGSVDYEAVMGLLTEEERKYVLVSVLPNFVVRYQELVASGQTTAEHALKELHDLAKHLV